MLVFKEYFVDILVLNYWLNPQISGQIIIAHQPRFLRNFEARVVYGRCKLTRSIGLGLHIGKNDPSFNFYQMKEKNPRLVKRKG